MSKAKLVCANGYEDRFLSGVYAVYIFALHYNSQIAVQFTSPFVLRSSTL